MLQNDSAGLTSKKLQPQQDIDAHISIRLFGRFFWASRNTLSRFHLLDRCMNKSFAMEYKQFDLLPRALVYVVMQLDIS